MVYILGIDIIHIKAYCSFVTYSPSESIHVKAWYYLRIPSLMTVIAVFGTGVRRSMGT